MKKYDNIDGLRAFACIGIVLMHVKSHANYNLGSSIVNKIIGSFSNFVFLFMIISAFGMCCGYYEKIKQGKMDIEKFYKRRFLKILPFFVLVTILEIVINYSYDSLIEGVSKFTGMFGFLSSPISVIGVSWFLGIVFIFYMIFPFFVFLFNNKRRAIVITLISVLMNLIAIGYFKVEITNFFFCFVYFALGGLIFIYKDVIEKVVNSWFKYLIGFILVVFIFFKIYNNNMYIESLLNMSCFSIILMYAIGLKENIVLSNKFVKFVSDISMEMYLAHMLIFQIIKKLNLLHITGNEFLSYSITCLGVIIGVILFSKVYVVIEDKFKYFFENRKNSGVLL